LIVVISDNYFAELNPQNVNQDYIVKTNKEKKIDCALIAEKTFRYQLINHFPEMFEALNSPLVEF
jgi:hypothetical protein